MDSKVGQIKAKAEDTGSNSRIRQTLVKPMNKSKEADQPEGANLKGGDPRNDLVNMNTKILSTSRRS